MHPGLSSTLPAIPELSAELWRSAAGVLEANGRGEHTVASGAAGSPQRSWDTAVAAIGLAYVNPGRAWRDLRRLFEAQRPDGRVPHVVPGADDSAAPPLHALAAWEVYRHGSAHGAAAIRQAGTELEWLHPRLVAAQDYLMNSRDLALAEPGFTTILATAELALAQIAGVLGHGSRARRHREDARRITAALAEQLWDPRTLTFHARDPRTGRLDPARGVTGLLPLMLPDLPPYQALALMTEAGRSGLPAPDHEGGPISLPMNWLLRRGMLVHGFRADAETLRLALLRLAHRAGTHERFHPADGSGLGAPDHTATAALCLDLLADRSAPAYAHLPGARLANV